MATADFIAAAQALCDQVRDDHTNHGGLQSFHTVALSDALRRQIYIERHGVVVAPPTPFEVAMQQGGVLGPPNGADK